MGDIGGAAQAGASLADTAMTDATNVYLQGKAQDFQASQAAIQRDWSAQQAGITRGFDASQAALNRSFQDTEQTKAEAYNTQMSNTAVQRRAEDIQKAGFNPLLAVSQLGGASTPSMSAPSGSAASASNPSGAAAAGLPAARIQGAMPGIIDALNSQSQRAVNQAQSSSLDSQAQLNKANADLATAKVPYASQQAAADLARTNQDINTLVSEANKNMSQYDINEQTVPNLEQDRNFRAQLQQGLVELQSLDITAKRNGIPEGAAKASVWDSPLGHYLAVSQEGARAGGDIGAAAALALDRLQRQAPLRKSAADVSISDPGSQSMLEDSGIGAPTP